MFVNDVSTRDLEVLAAGGTRLVALRCAGFNNVDLAAAERLGIAVARVPAYSPHAVAEYTVGLILALNRKIHRAYNRVREDNFALDGLLGFDLFGKTVGMVGTGKIGALVARTLAAGLRLPGAGPRRLRDPELVEHRRRLRRAARPSPPLGHRHAALPADAADAPPRQRRQLALGEARRDAGQHQPRRPGRRRAVIAGLKTGRIGYLAIDVYEEEADLFFEDLSNRIIQDDVFPRLLTFPNVLVTGHQAFFTREALTAIADTTLANITAFERGENLVNAVSAELVGR